MRIWWLVACLVVAPRLMAFQDPVIERLAAVVEGEPITDSQVRAVVGLRLPIAGSVPAPKDALEALITRSLVLIELSHFTPPEPTAAQVRAREQQWQATLPAGTDLAAELVHFGHTEDTLLTWFKNELRINAYLTNRFSAGVRPTHDELLAYYTAHASDFARGGTTPSFEAVQDVVRQRLSADMRDQYVKEWIAQLRARADVVVIK